MREKCHEKRVKKKRELKEKSDRLYESIKYQSESKEYLADWVYEKYGHFPGNDHICGFMPIELMAKAANKAGSLNKEDMIEVMMNNTFNLANLTLRVILSRIFYHCSSNSPISKILN